MNQSRSTTLLSKIEQKQNSIIVSSMIGGFLNKKPKHFETIPVDEHDFEVGTSLTPSPSIDNNVENNNNLNHQAGKKSRAYIMNEMRLNRTLDTPARKRQGSCSAVRNALNTLYCVDDFDMLEFIDQGFYSDVYKVKHRTSGEIMVMKINKDVNESRSEMRTRYKAAVRKEAQLMTQLNHHNVLRFKGVCVDHTVGKWQLHALTEFCNGGSVQRLILAQAKTHPCPTDLKDRVSMTADIASGMAYLNSKHIMHRDLTPMNILLKQCGFFTRCVIADFGLACPIPVEGQPPLMQVGTPLWMAPECLKEEFYTSKADVFSFGIILCQLIAMIDADPDEGFPRTPIYGLDYEKFVEKCAPANTPLQLLELAFHCCLMNPFSRPNFDECYKRLLHVQRRETTQINCGQQRRPSKFDAVGQTADRLGLARSASDVAYLLKRVGPIDKNATDIRDSTSDASTENKVTPDDNDLLSRAEALKMAKKMATLDPAYELSIAVSNPFRKYFGGGRALLMHSRNNAERQRATPNSDAASSLSKDSPEPSNKAKKNPQALPIDLSDRALCTVDTLYKWQNVSERLSMLGDDLTVLSSCVTDLRRTQSLPSSPAAERCLTDNYSSIDTLAIANCRDLQLKEQLSKKFRDSDAQFADVKKQALKRNLIGTNDSNEFQQSSTPKENCVRLELALSPIASVPPVDTRQTSSDNISKASNNECVSENFYNLPLEQRRCNIL